jgi:hypothetical protein
MAMLAIAGVTPIETRVAAVTVSVVDPDTAPSVAVIVEDPGLTAVVTPVVPAVLLTVAIVGAEELQVTMLVRSCIELSV